MLNISEGFLDNNYYYDERTGRLLTDPSTTKGKERRITDAMLWKEYKNDIGKKLVLQASGMVFPTLLGYGLGGLTGDRGAAITGGALGAMLGTIGTAGFIDHLAKNKVAANYDRYK